MKYNIYNPTQARRIIYDGFEGQKRIDVGPLETKYGVAVADHVAAAYGNGLDGRKDDLWFTPETAPPAPAKQEPVAAAPPAAPEPPAAPLGPPPTTMPQDYKRYMAPLVDEPSPKDPEQDLIEAAILDEALDDEKPEPEKPKAKPKKKPPKKKAKKKHDADAA